MNKILKKIMSSAMALSIVLSSMVVSYAAGENSVNVKTRVNGEYVDTVFLGETVETVLSFENMGEYSNFDVVLVYNSDVIQVEKIADGTVVTSDGYCDFVAQDCVTLADYLKNNTDPVQSILVPEIPASGSLDAMGAVMLSRQARGSVAVTEDKDAAIIPFVAEALGQSGFRFAEGSTDADRVYDASGWDIGNDKQLKFPPLATVSENVVNFEVIEKPDAPNPEWGQEGTADEYIVSWDEPATGARGYEVEILVEGVSKKTLTVAETEIDMVAYIPECGIGNYEVKVAAKGGAYNSAAVSATRYIAGIPLKLGDVDLVDKTLTWDKVENADKYQIVVKKDGEDDPVATIDIADPDTLTKDLADKFAVGDYTITITAKSNAAGYLDASKAVEYKSGSSITGNVKLIIHSSSKYKPNPDNKTEVVLKDKNGTEVKKAVCEDDGSFAITGVPADADGYTVTLKRPGAVTRVLCDGSGNAVKLVLNASIEKNICAPGASISLHMGDFLNKDSVEGDNLNRLIDNYGKVKGADGYDEVYDITDYVLMAGDDIEEIINGFDITAFIFNYRKGTRTYRSYVDEFSL